MQIGMYKSSEIFHPNQRMLKIWLPYKRLLLLKRPPYNSYPINRVSAGSYTLENSTEAIPM